MKKLLLRGIAIVMALTFLFSFSVEKDSSVYAKNKKMVMYSTPTIKSIKIRIENSKKSSYYKIYKATLSKAYVKNTLSQISRIPKKKYKLLKKTSRKQYVDKKVKKNKYYAYIVKGFSKKGTKVEEYSERDPYYCLRNNRIIDTPTLEYDYFYDEMQSSSKCSSKKLRMYLNNRGGGLAATSYILYRKEDGGKKFKKLYEKKTSGYNQFGEISKFITDKKVKATTKYYYKVRFCLKTKKKKIYSKMSDPIDLWAVESWPKYDVKCLTKPFSWNYKKDPNGKHDFVFSITDKKTNGKTILYKWSSEYYDGLNNVDCNFDEYSFDNANWMSFPEYGLELSKGKPIYIKCSFVIHEYDKFDEVNFLGEKKNSYISFSHFEYFGPVGRYTGKGLIDFGTRFGTIYEYDHSD